MKWLQNKQRKIIKILAGTGLVLLLANQSKGDSIFRGARGPTEWQLDSRVTLNERSLNGFETKEVINNNILKYWNGQENGVFGFISIPYKSLDNGTSESRGLGDISIGFGPRGIVTNKFGSGHYLPYIGMSLPTGNFNSKPALGNNRYDLRIGSGFTLYTSSKKGELDAALEYTKPGIGSNLQISDNLYGGFLIARQLSARFRAGAGLIGNFRANGPKEGDYILTSRIAARYTHSKKWHAEFWGDFDIASRNMPSGFSGTLALRYNF